MRIAEKGQVVEELSRRLGEAKGLYLTDFTGLDVGSMTELRRRLAEAQVEYVVVKNTLAKRALTGTGFESLVVQLEGPNAFAVPRNDVVIAAKILTEFAKDREKPKIKAGVIEGRIVSVDEIRRLAALPPREVLLAQLLGSARAPIVGLVSTLHALLAKFVRTVDAVRAQKEAAAPVAEAVAEPVAEAVAEPVAEAAAEPVAETPAEPAVEEQAPAEPESTEPSEDSQA